LFEGVATGAADGYGRMAGRPAATLLHLGPGLGNGLANLSNAQGGLTFAAEELEEWGKQSVRVRNLPGAGLGPGRVRRGSFH